MTRLPLATDLKTRIGATSTKDARQVNSYVEVKGDQAVVRKRPAAQGGIAVGTGTAQGGIGLTINGTPYFIGFWGDTMQTYTGSGTSWSSGSSYVIGDHVSVDFVDYWAIADNSNSQPPSSNWSRAYVPAVPGWRTGTVIQIPLGEIAYNGTIYIYLTFNQATSKICPHTSSDGISWTQQSDTSLSSSGVANIAIDWNGSQFLAVNLSGTSAGYWGTSINGITWTIYNDGGATPAFYDVAWNGSTYCAVSGSSVYTSSDGISWSLQTSPVGDFRAITWNGTVFCAVSMSSSLAITSTDGITWISRTLPSSTLWNRIATLSGVLCVACNTNNITAASSDNGATWTQSTLSGITSSSWIASGNGIFLTVSSSFPSANYCTSTDGIVWTTRTLPVSSAWPTAFYGDRFIVIDNTDICATSITGQ